MSKFEWYIHLLYVRHRIKSRGWLTISFDYTEIKRTTSQKCNGCTRDKVIYLQYTIYECTRIKLSLHFFLHPSPPTFAIDRISRRHSFSFITFDKGLFFLVFFSIFDTAFIVHRVLFRAVNNDRSVHETLLQKFFDSSKRVKTLQLYLYWLHYRVASHS